MSWKTQHTLLFSVLAEGQYTKETLQRAIEVLRGDDEPLNLGEIGRFKGPTQDVRSIALHSSGALQVLFTDPDCAPELWIGRLFIDPDEWTDVVPVDATYVLPLGFDPNGNPIFLWLDCAERQGLFLRFCDKDIWLASRRIAGNWNVKELEQALRKIQPPVIWFDKHGKHAIVPCPDSQGEGWHSAWIITHHQDHPHSIRHYQERRCLGVSGRHPIWLETVDQEQRIRVGRWRTSFFQKILPETVFVDGEMITSFLVIENDRLVFVEARDEADCKIVSIGSATGCSRNDESWSARIGTTLLVKEWGRSKEALKWRLIMIRNGSTLFNDLMHESFKSGDQIVLLDDRGIAILRHGEDYDEVLIFNRDGERIHFGREISDFLRSPCLRIGECSGGLVVNHHFNTSREPSTIYVINPFVDEEFIRRQIEQGAPSGGALPEDVAYVEGYGCVAVRNKGKKVLSLRRFGR